MGEIITYALNGLFRARYRLLSVGAVLLLLGLLVSGIYAMDYNWRWSRIPQYFWHEKNGEWRAGPFLKGLLLTFQLSLTAGFCAIVLGGVLMMARISIRPVLRLGASFYTQFIRCTPLLVQLYLFYFFLGNVVGFERFTAGVVSLSLFEAAFVAEIIRSGYMAVPHGQAEAGQALGLSKLKRLRLIILPQALPLILPALANLFVSLIKHSSIVTIIAIAELTDTARNLVSESFLVFEIWLTVGALYVSICFPLAWVINRWERRLRQR